MPMSNALSLANFKAPLKGILKPWNFDLGAITFTAGMAKRGTSVFAAAPVVQGRWDGVAIPDRLTFPRGTQLANIAQDTFYSNLDMAQGAIAFWVTPEWSAGDGRTHFLYGTVNNILIRSDSADSNLYLYVHDGTAYRSASVDIGPGGANWVAGGTYFVVARWDMKNTLDGTNYVCLSLNDAHTFGGTTSVGIAIPVATQYIGASSDNWLQADALIEGLTIYRRPLWDGTYGIDVGNGDEINSMYAAGAGADPCLTTGSWDVVFCMPTDATPGALVTGPGEAWSHPHSSAEPEHAFVDDGFGPHQESAILFDGADTWVDLTSNLVFDDMPDGANGFQVGAWVRLDTTTTDYIARKYTGWRVRITFNGLRLGATVNCAGGDAVSSVFVSNWGLILPDGKWHWVLMSFHHSDNGGDSKIYLQVDGRWATSYVVQTAGIGAYVSDVAQTMYYGSLLVPIDGAGGWLALWNNVAQYPVGTDNIPPRTKPGAGGNLIEAWQCDDRVNAITATVTTPGNDGTLANGTWERKFNVEATPVMPQSVDFDGATTDLNAGSGANIDDLHNSGVTAGTLTAEAWVRADGWGNGDVGIIFIKGTASRGYQFHIQSGVGLRGYVYCATTPADSRVAFTPDGVWHHVRMEWDDTGAAWGARTIRIWVDGIEPSYTQQTAGVGAVATEAADNLYIGSNGTNQNWDGGIGAVRVSNNIRATADFTPAARTAWYANDANAHLLYAMTDGAGATVTDTSGNGYNGTLAATYRWDNTYDKMLDSPGAGPFQNGYVFGANGVGDGIGSLIDVTAETDYVVRAAFSPGQDSRGLWYVYVWDDVGSAQIGANYQMPSYHGLHTGANNSATLIDAGARWPQSLVGATVYNITDGSSAMITAISGAMTTITAALAGGTDNDWDTNDEYRIFWSDGYHNHPWVEPFVFRTPVGCTRIDVRVLSGDGEGTLYVHQVEIQESLLDNGDIEAALVGIPPIPPLWVNVGLDAGDTQAEAAIIHSGTQSMRFNVGATASERCYRSLTSGGAGSFLGCGVATYGSGVAALTIGTTSFDHGLLQADPALRSVIAPVVAAWSHVPFVQRAVAAATSFAIYGGGAILYADDGYTFRLDDITLTVTPASQANSLESEGIRVDGYDNCTQTIPAGAILFNRGSIRWSERGRHAAALLAGFGNTGATLLHAWGNATNYIRVYATAANNIRLEFNDGGGAHQANWNCTGLIAVDTAYEMEVRWRPNRMQLYQDGNLRATITQPVSFATVPATAYWGSRQAGDEQIDAVFGAP